MVGELVGSLSAASTELEASAGTLTSTADLTQKLSRRAKRHPPRRTFRATCSRCRWRARKSPLRSTRSAVRSTKPRALRKSAVVQANEKKTDASIAELSTAASAHWRRRQADHGHCRTDQPARTQRHDRSGPRRRGWPRLCGRCVGSEGTGCADGEGHGRNLDPQIGGHASGDRCLDHNVIKEIGATINTISKISSTIAAAVEEQGAATQEIARNVQQAAQMSSLRSSPTTRPRSIAVRAKPVRRHRRCCLRRSRCRRKAIA